jgi:glutaredoxin
MLQDTLTLPKKLYSKIKSESIEISELIEIIKHSEFVILYSPWCGYSKNALQLLDQKRISHKSVDFDKINASMEQIRRQLSKERSLRFPESYSTRPMIFINGKFIGGYTDLKTILSK